MSTKPSPKRIVDFPAAAVAAVAGAGAAAAAAVATNRLHQTQEGLRRQARRPSFARARFSSNLSVRRDIPAATGD